MIALTWSWRSLRSEYQLLLHRVGAMRNVSITSSCPSAVLSRVVPCTPGHPPSSVPCPHVPISSVPRPHVPRHPSSVPRYPSPDPSLPFPVPCSLSTATCLCSQSCAAIASHHVARSLSPVSRPPRLRLGLDHCFTCCWNGPLVPLAKSELDRRTCEASLIIFHLSYILSCTDASDAPMRQKMRQQF